MMMICITQRFVRTKLRVAFCPSTCALNRERARRRRASAATSSTTAPALLGSAVVAHRFATSVATREKFASFVVVVVVIAARLTSHHIQSRCAVIYFVHHRQHTATSASFVHCRRAHLHRAFARSLTWMLCSGWQTRTRLHRDRVNVLSKCLSPAMREKNMIDVNILVR